MLSLHNILLISQPSSSQHSHPPPSTTSSDHPHPHHHHHNSNRNVHQDHSNNNHLSESSFWSLKNRKDGGGGDDDDGDGSLKVCKDCGNRAKKECSFRRCRTCCKTRGFDCDTHVRSTWIPASKRQEKKIGSGGASGSGSRSPNGVKRPRAFVASPSSHNCSANHLTLGICSHPPQPQDSRFKKSLPGKIEATAFLRNIRVTDISDGEAENAYVATVNISGHVFKGLLYDHGSQNKMETSTNEMYRRDSSSTYTAASGN